MKRTALFLAAGLAPVLTASAQNSIDSTLKYAWSENAGWMNWRDANNGASGVRDNRVFLSGWIWCENIGWVTLGDGTPANSLQYGNTTGTDCGVNIGEGGALTGLAWGENVGWINFSGGAAATPAKPARIDLASNRLRGYAWGENIGWVNLDDAAKYVKLSCYANCDGSTGAPALTANDFQCFINAFAAQAPYANCDRSSAVPMLTANDFQCFFDAYAAGCT